MTRRERERKIKMFGMIGMSILVIGSLATATYAWFVNRPATITTNTMTVDTVEETTWKFYAYNGNLSDTYEDDRYVIGWINVSFETNEVFTLVESENDTLDWSGAKRWADNGDSDITAFTAAPEDEYHEINFKCVTAGTYNVYISGGGEVFFTPAGTGPSTPSASSEASSPAVASSAPAAPTHANGWYLVGDTKGWEAADERLGIELPKCFDNEFTEITDDNKAALATTAGLFAGDAVTFAIEVTGLEGDSYDIRLDLTGVRSNTWNDQRGGDYHRKARKMIDATPVTREVNVGWAMDIFAMGGNDSDIYLDSSNWNDDVYNHTFENNETFVVDPGEHKINLVSETSQSPSSGGSYYLFYQAYFSDDPSTYFIEQRDNTYSSAATYPLTSNHERYFLYGEGSGDSNLYAGLRFELTNLSLDVKAAVS